MQIPFGPTHKPSFQQESRLVTQVHHGAAAVVLKSVQMSAAAVCGLSTDLCHRQDGPSDPCCALLRPPELSHPLCLHFFPLMQIPFETSWKLRKRRSVTGVYRSHQGYNGRPTIYGVNPTERSLCQFAESLSSSGYGDLANVRHIKPLFRFES
jgi:hypothetical protein